MYSEAHVILEILMNCETARVLSTWDLKGVTRFLEVPVPVRPFLCEANHTSCCAQGLDSRQIIAASDQSGLRNLLEGRIISADEAQHALDVLAQAARLEDLPKVGLCHLSVCAK